MLEDFIERNDINAEFINFSTNSSTDLLIANKKLPASSTVKIQLFNSKNNNPFIVITPFQSELNFEKIKLIMLENDLVEQNSDESVEITGYKKGFIPPISIFGIKIIIDYSLKTKNFLFCRVSEKSFLKVFLKSVLETNEDILFENICSKS
ncbi:MAG: YbaK/EbsC family protein [Candidatus ainarchaeum sp.]|nr:YbaK/EbsC family protein [Candidatus ainarchaeum sp.]